MKVEVLIAGVTHDTWFRGTRDERQVTNLNCLDMTAHLGLKLKQTFDFVPSKEDADGIDLEALEGRRITVAVSEIKAGSAGRLKFAGQIDRSSLPKEALNGGTKNTPPPKQP